MVAPLFLPPSLDDLIILLRAWRFWLVAFLLGSLLGLVIYALAPLPYRARATVLVDFNMEKAWPTDTDREQFYYLERETRKLEEIAWSDEVLQQVAERADGVTVADLRRGKLQLGQPGEGGWHFYAYDPQPQRATLLAATWAESFANAVTQVLAQDKGLNTWIQVQVTQREGLPLERRPSLAVCLFSGGLSLTLLAALAVSFVAPWHPSAYRR